MTKFRVSTSEVSTFLTCKQRWMYAHHPSYNLEPRTLGKALYRGIIGHEALEIYYKTNMDGNNHEKGVEASNAFIVKKALEETMKGDSEKALMISSLGVLVNSYYEETKWLWNTYNITGVEQIVTAPLPGVNDIEFAGRIDLGLEINSGPNKGEAVPWDHKFTYNFWSEKALKMNPQISNYIWSYREMGVRSRRGIINMLRYRNDAVESFDQKEVPSTSSLRNTFINNHVVAAQQIVELKHKDKVTTLDGITRSSSKFNCEYCPFIDLCHTEANGQDSSTMIKASFRPNSYGYDNELDVT